MFSIYKATDFRNSNRMERGSRSRSEFNVETVRKSVSSFLKIKIETRSKIENQSNLE